MSYWYHKDSEGRIRVHWGRAVILPLLLVLVAATTAYFLTAGTAGFRGRVALHNQVRSAESQQVLYNGFHDDCHAVVALNAQVKTVETSIAEQRAHPPANDPFGQFQQQIAQRQTDLDGLKNQRDQKAQAYNAASHEPLTKAFMKSRDLPTEINPPYDQLQCESQPAAGQGS